MDKEKVIDYVMNSPQNTNRAVLSTLLDEGGGGGSITMTTLFDEDITFTYQENEKYMNTLASYTKEMPDLNTDYGFVKVTLDNSIIILGTSSIDYNNYAAIYTAKNSFSLFSDSDLYNISVNYNKGGSDYFEIISMITAPSTGAFEKLETYCNENHHLKMEWFII